MAATETQGLNAALLIAQIKAHHRVRLLASTSLCMFVTLQGARAQRGNALERPPNCPAALCTISKH